MMWKVTAVLVLLLANICLSYCSVSGIDNTANQQNLHHSDDNVQTVIEVNNGISDDQWEELKRELKSAVTTSISESCSNSDQCEEISIDERLRLQNLGKEWKYAACSCKEIAEKTEFSSDYYWIKVNENSTPQPVYCDLDSQFSNGTKGWLRIANWNMDKQSQCPKGYASNFKLTTSPRRLCGKPTTTSGCVQIRYSAFGYQYNRVCGRVIGRRSNTPDGFKNYICGVHCTIDSTYLDGVSITYENLDKTHIWSFAANECNRPGYYPPAFVGDNYFCDASTELWSNKQFCTELPFHGMGYIYLRLCTDREDNEDVQIQLVELYVQ